MHIIMMYVAILKSLFVLHVSLPVNSNPDGELTPEDNLLESMKSGWGLSCKN